MHPKFTVDVASSAILRPLRMVVLNLCIFTILLIALLTGCSSGTAGSSSPDNPSSPINPVSIATTTLTSGVVGLPYSSSIQAVNGTSPYTFAITAGTLPAGLTLAANGAISGTPTAAGNSTFQVQVTDSSNPVEKSLQSLGISIVAPVVIGGGALPAGAVGSAYSSTVQATGGTPPYVYTITSGALPAGLTLLSSGIISGTPTTAGIASFSIQATDSASTSQRASAAFTLAIQPPPLVVTTTTLPNAQLNTAYATSLQANGGTQPYTFSLKSGALPLGLTLSPSGTIAGTPTNSGTSTFTVAVKDASSTPQTVSINLSITVSSSPLSVHVVSLATPVLGSSYNQTIVVSGGTAPYAFVISSGSLPTGLTISSSGTITGTPTALGTFAVTLQVTDSSQPTPVVAPLAIALTVVRAIVQINAASTLATVPQTGFGIHTSVYDASLSDTTNLPALLQTGGITVMRYPGGIYSDNYHWAQNTLTPFFVSTSPVCGVVANGYLAPKTDFGNFVKTLQAVGAQAIITVNYGTSVADSSATKKTGTYGPNTCSEPNQPGQPQEAAAWVAYANGSPTNTQVIGVDAAGFNWQTVGFWASLRAATPLATDDGYNFLRLGQIAPIGVKYWELGNEIFYDGYNSNQNTETDLHAPYSYPSGYSGTYTSRSGVSTISPTAYGTNAVPFIQAMKAADPTIQIGLTMSSPNVDPIPSTWNPAVLNAVCTSANFDFAILHYYPGSYKNVTAAQLFSLPQNDMPALVSTLKTQLAANCPAIANTIKFLVTETGPNGTLATGTPSQVPGLYAAHEYLVSLETGIINVDWLELHSDYLTTTTEAPNPPFYGIQLAHLLAGVGDTLVSATSTSDTILAHATLKANGQKGILLINADPQNQSTVQVTISGASMGATASEYTYGIGTTQSTPALQATSVTVTGNTVTVTVPAYTAVELLIN
jgi:hypothetical protein